MVKKRQTDANDGTSSTDSGEEELLNGHAHGAASGATICQHIKKGVDTAQLRRNLKSTGLLYECVKCQTLAGANGGETAAECEVDNTLWLCLKCGSQLCGRARNQHALQHHQVSRSSWILPILFTLSNLCSLLSLSIFLCCRHLARIVMLWH